jgi:hypothetical protein
VDACVTRALSGPQESWKLARGLIGAHGFLVYFAGASWSGADESELAASGLAMEICVPASFPWQGPLIKMAWSSESHAEVC